VHAGFAAATEAKTKEAEFLYDLVISDPDYMKLVTDVEGFRLRGAALRFDDNWASLMTMNRI
jgi:hypothetical protein